MKTRYALLGLLAAVSAYAVPPPTGTVYRVVQVDVNGLANVSNITVASYSVLGIVDDTNTLVAYNLTIQEGDLQSYTNFAGTYSGGTNAYGCIWLGGSSLYDATTNAVMNTMSNGIPGRWYAPGEVSWVDVQYGTKLGPILAADTNGFYGKVWLGSNTNAPWIQGLGTTNIMFGAGTNWAIFDWTP